MNWPSSHAPMRRPAHCWRRRRMNLRPQRSSYTLRSCPRHLRRRNGATVSSRQQVQDSVSFAKGGKGDLGRGTDRESQPGLEDDVMQEKTNQPQRKVRLGIVGGGPGSNIGETHRYAARLDNRYALVTGVFTSDADRSRGFAATLGIAPDRPYGSLQEVGEQDGQREQGLAGG